MRKVVHLQDFGLHKRGDVVEVPDDAEVSPMYFADYDEAAGETPAPPPEATPESRGVAEPSDDFAQVHDAPSTPEEV